MQMLHRDRRKSTEVQAMKNLIVVVGLASIVGAAPAAAQNLVITNARVLDGTGKVIERGSVVVRDGKIASVAAGAAAGDRTLAAPVRPRRRDRRRPAAIRRASTPRGLRCVPRNRLARFPPQTRSTPSRPPRRRASITSRPC